MNIYIFNLHFFFHDCFFVGFFFHYHFKQILLGIPSVSNSLDPDQTGHFAGPDLGPNCLQRLSAVR